MKRIRLTLSKDIIANAVARDSKRCMIADAVQRQVPNAHFVAVDLQSIRWSDPSLGLRYMYFTPPAAQRALLAFDQGRRDDIEPFTCVLRTGEIFKMSARRSDKDRDERSKKWGKVRQETKAPAKRYMASRYRRYGIRQYEI